MGTEYEKDFDDEVYEDGFYEDNFDEEELTDDEDNVLDEADEDDKEDWDEIDEKKIDVSFACEDCDYRWEDVIIKRRDELDGIEDINPACPMCGSINITQI